MLNVSGKKVNALVIKEIPESYEKITNDFDINIAQIKNLDFYLRPPEACPFARGNWIIDITFKDNSLFCLKLPLEMTEGQVRAWLSPLTDKMHQYPTESIEDK